MSYLFASLWEDHSKRKGGGGGGGKSKPETLAGQPVRSPRIDKLRIERFRPVKATWTKTSVIVKAKFLRPTAAGSHLGIQGTIDYLQKNERNREREPKERLFFDKGKEDIDGKEAFERMLASKGAHTSMYHVILAPSGNDLDHVAFTRDWVERLQERQGFDVEWLAVTHKNTAHHHVHLLIAGAVPEQERFLGAQFLEGRDLRFDRDDLNAMREMAVHEYYKARGLEHEYLLNKTVEQELDLKWSDERPVDLLKHEYLSKEEREELGLRDDRDQVAEVLGRRSLSDDEQKDLGINLSMLPDERFRSLIDTERTEEKQQDGEKRIEVDSDDTSLEYSDEELDMQDFGEWSDDPRDFAENQDEWFDFELEDDPFDVCEEDTTSMKTNSWDVGLNVNARDDDEDSRRHPGE